MDLGVLGDPRMRRCPPRPPSPVDSASFLVSENKEVTVLTAWLSGLGPVLGGPCWPGPGTLRRDLGQQPTCLRWWAAGIPDVGLAPGDLKTQGPMMCPLILCPHSWGPPPCTWAAQRVCGLEGAE